MKGTKFKAMFLSIIPGAGHLYLGLQKTGLQLMISFFLMFYLADLLNNDVFFILAPVIWLFSFFDVRNRISTERPLEDNGLKLFSNIKTTKILGFNTFQLAGGFLILIGFLALLDQVILPLLNIQLAWMIRNYLQQGLISIIFIGLGAKLIMGSKQSQGLVKGEEVSCETAE